MALSLLNAFIFNVKAKQNKKNFIREMVKFCTIEFPKGSVLNDLIEIKALRLVLGTFIFMNTITIIID